nr:hypothetical protein [Ornithinimicrobium flavum]
MSSTRTTASAPTGMGAPVMIRHAWPGTCSRGSGSPAATSPDTTSTTGVSGPAPARSSRRTAYPSIEELSNLGRSARPCTSPLVTSPTERVTGTVTVATGLI